MPTMPIAEIDPTASGDGLLSLLSGHGDPARHDHARVDGSHGARLLPGAHRAGPTELQIKLY